MTAESRLVAATDARHAEDGFTLLELLISLVLIAAVLSMLPGAMRVAQQATRGEATMAEDAGIAATRSYLAQVLSAAMPLVLRSEDGRAGLAFSGSADGLSFIAATAAGPGGPGLYRHVLRVEPSPRTSDGGGRYHLVLRKYQHPRVHGSEDQALLQRTLLGADFRIRIRYFGAAQAGGEKTWLDQWTRPHAMPELIELMLPSSANPDADMMPLLVKPQLAPPA